MGMCATLSLLMSSKCFLTIASAALWYMKCNTYDILNVCYPYTVQTPAVKSAIIRAVVQLRRSHNNAWELELSQPIFLKVLVTVTWIWTTCYGMHICLQITVPFTCFMCSYEEPTVQLFDTLCHLPMMYIAQTMLQDECCITFCTHSLTKNHNVESLCTDFFSLCTVTI